MACIGSATGRWPKTTAVRAKGTGPRAMAVFANLALTILRLREVSNIAAEMRALAANAAAALDLVAL